MKGHDHRLSPLSDHTTRRERLDEIGRRIRSGRYFVPAEEVAAALLADLGWEDPDCSSCGGSDADAN